MALTSWATHVLQWHLQKEAKPRGGANPEKMPKFGLESATRLHEVGIASIADQHAAVNTFPGLVHTARHTTGVDRARSRDPNPTGGERLRRGRRLG